MFPSWLVALLVLLRERWSVRRDAQIRFLTLQIEILRTRLPGNRVVLSPTERQRLLKIGVEVDHEVHHTIRIVTFKTYRRWLRELRRGRRPGRAGRPRLTKSLRDLIVRLAKENAGWGVRRIVGEMKKLAVKVSRSSIRRVLVDEKILPDPDRRAPRGVLTPWRKFIAIHMNVIVACDFFCKTVWTPLGRKTAYVLMLIHLGSRKVFLSPATYNPDDDWMCQQARNARMWAEDEGVDVRFLIHDRDTKFSAAFDRHFKRSDGGAVRTPFMTPIANCFAESWISGCKREVLNQFFCFSLRQLDYIVQSYAVYFNQYRPHQGLGNVPPDTRGAPPPPKVTGEPGPITRHTWLGGLLSHYTREAA